MHSSSSEALLMLYVPQPEEGQGLVEYAMILMCVAIVVLGLITIIGPTVGNMFSNVVNHL
jgi:pilus assembly protein Flp/PilA